MLQVPAETATHASTRIQVTGVSGLADNRNNAFIKDTHEFIEVKAPIYRYPLKEDKKAGYLVPYRIYRALTDKTLADWRTAVLRTTFSRLPSEEDIIAYPTLPKSKGVPPPVGFTTRP